MNYFGNPFLWNELESGKKNLSNIGFVKMSWQKKVGLKLFMGKQKIDYFSDMFSLISMKEIKRENQGQWFQIVLLNSYFSHFGAEFFTIFTLNKHSNYKLFAQLSKLWSLICLSGWFVIIGFFIGIIQWLNLCLFMFFLIALWLLESIALSGLFGAFWTLPFPTTIIRHKTGSITIWCDK